MLCLVGARSIEDYESVSFSLPPATKLGQGNTFRSVCQEFCSQRWWGRLGGLAGGGGLQAHTRGDVGGVWSGGGIQAHTRGRGGSPGPGPGGYPSMH